MAKFLSLITFTQEGMRNVKDTIHRSEAFRSEAAAAGANVESAYWAMGEYDGCLLMESPDEETATALLLRLGQKGNVRTRTLRLYTKDEFQKILGKV